MSNATVNRAELARILDHTVIKPDTTREQVVQLCREAKEHGFGVVCVAGAWIEVAVEQLAGSECKVASIVGFPHGNALSAAKADEAARAVDAGARELDMVLHVGALRSGAHDAVLGDIRGVVDAAPGVVVKVILETALLTDDQKVLACRIAEDAGAAFVKTSTGFCGGGATLDDVRLMRSTVGDRLGVKASGGIGNYEQAVAMVQAGATRIGCSASLAIVSGAPA